MESPLNDFNPSFPLFKNGHLQTLVAAVPLFGGEKRLATFPTEGLRIAIPTDGPSVGTLGATLHLAPTGRGTVVLVHGVGGGATSRYIVRAAVAFLEAGFHVVRVNLRGAGGTHVHCASLYHVGLGEDLDVILDFLAGDSRLGPLFLCGFSGGGNVTLKRAGEWGDQAPRALTGVAALGAPVDLAAAARVVQATRNFPYHHHVLRGLKASAIDLYRAFPDRVHYTPKDVRAASSISAYDAAVIVPMHGFSSVSAYHDAASAMHRLAEIRVPAIVVHADDDPMVPGSTVRGAYTTLPTHVRQVRTAHGGHLGWVGSFREDGWIASYGVARVIEYFKELLAKPAITR